jgi:(S)-2-hydroxyglutarate dehydrogenase
MQTFDFIIVGGGIVGLATALQLNRNNPQARICVMEKEASVGTHQTGHNSGVIHSGLYYKPGSSKAQTCVEGARLMVEFCQQHAIPYRVCGKLVVATSESELSGLAELFSRGQKNGVPGIAEIGPEQIKEFEPHAAGIKALRIPGGAIVDYSSVARKYAELLQNAGGSVQSNSPVYRIREMPDAIVVESKAGEFSARQVINCAGLHSDRVARICRQNPEARIVPFRGEYYMLSPAAEKLVKGLIYPVPDARFPFLGVHFTQMIGGGVEAGPNAVLAFKREGYKKLSFNLRDSVETLTYPGFWRMALKHWRTGMGEVYRSWSKRAFLRALQRLVPELTMADLLPGGSGVRAQALLPTGAMVDDFCVQRTGAVIHVLNAPSPAATASLAIGKQIAQMAAAPR